MPRSKHYVFVNGQAVDIDHLNLRQARSVVRSFVNALRCTQLNSSQLKGTVLVQVPEASQDEIDRAMERGR
jgi:hypothetical protein